MQSVINCESNNMSTKCYRHDCYSQPTCSPVWLDSSARSISRVKQRFGKQLLTRTAASPVAAHRPSALRAARTGSGRAAPQAPSSPGPCGCAGKDGPHPEGHGRRRAGQDLAFASTHRRGQEARAAPACLPAGLAPAAPGQTAQLGTRCGSCRSSCRAGRPPPPGAAVSSHAARTGSLGRSRACCISCQILSLLPPLPSADRAQVFAAKPPVLSSSLTFQQS